jgi:hypothetical protein
LVHHFLQASEPISQFMHWLQYDLGTQHTAYGRSYSQAMLESFNFWGLLEGTHLLSLMLFFGTIVVVDSRLLGWTFRKTPVSVVSDRLLPLTVIAMVIAMTTGPLLFLSKPQEYYHNAFFRFKMVLLVLAILNVWVFHKMVQKNQAEWDTAESPPGKAKLSGLLSILFWVGVMSCGRLIAYNFLECGKPHPVWLNTFAGCKYSPHGAMTEADYQKQLLDEKAAADAAAAAEAAPATDPAAAPAGAAQPEAK